MKYTALELSTEEYLEQFREGVSKAAPCYLLPLRPREDSKHYNVYLEFFKRGKRFSQLAIWWQAPGDNPQSEVVLPCHSNLVLTFGHINEGSQTVRPLVMQPYEAKGLPGEKDHIPARPAYNVWPIWPYVLDFSVCMDHGGVSFRLSPPRMATHISVSASLSSSMSLGFTDKKV